MRSHGADPRSADDGEPRAADSAGQPWAGRRFQDNAHSEDDGSAPAGLLEAIAAFRQGNAGASAVVDVVRQARLLIPLLAEAGETGVNERGVRIDKSQELSIVTVVGPDGRNVLPVFSSVAAMSAWNPQARPVPATGERVAVAAASENTDLVVLDATSETEFAIRRPALWAMARQEPWDPSYESSEVGAAFASAVREEAAVLAIGLAPGDPQARLAGPELEVTLTLIDGLDQDQLRSLLARLAERWGASEVIAARVDSMAVKLKGQ